MASEIALITGAASGIGAAVAAELARSGVRVVLADVAAERGEKLASELGGRFFACDVSDPQQWEQLVGRCIAEAGVPDYAHLNAGIMSVPPDADFQPIEQLPLERYRRIMGVNLDGVFFGMRALIPHMRARGGAITVTASMAGLMGIAMDPVYAATKHALVGLVRSVAEALAGTPLRVNAICPGGVDTAITPDAMRSSIAQMSAAVLAREVVDLLRRGPSGEIRVKTLEHLPAFAVPVPELGPY
jgi:NAD(P)-dependent dehydrogenase (short-subunit alcohol dehydrogenase family)